MSALHFVYVSASTMFELVSGVVMGYCLARYMRTAHTTAPALSYVTLRIMLSSMLFGNLCLDISPRLLRSYYMAVVMSLVPQLLGATMAWLLRGFVVREWRVLLLLGSTFQNGLFFPLSVVTSVRGVTWLDAAARRECQQYVFLYNLTCAVGLWSIGNPLIIHCRDTLAAERDDAAMIAAHAQARQAWLREHKEQQQQQQQVSCRDDRETRAVCVAHDDKDSGGNDCDHNTTATAAPSLSAAPTASSWASTAHDALALYRPPLRRERPIAVDKFVLAQQQQLQQQLQQQGVGDAPRCGVADDVHDVYVHARDRPLSRRVRRVAGTVWFALNTLPVALTLLAIAISLTPPLRWCAESPPGRALLGGIARVGQACVPLSLIVFGIILQQSNAMTSRTTTMPAVTATVARGDDDDDAVPLSLPRRLLHAVRGISHELRFTILAIVLRLLCIPAASLLIVHALLRAKLMPTSRPFVLSILVGVSSPTAVNASLVCMLQRFHEREFARMLFWMHCFAAITSTLWIAVSIAYASRMPA